MKVEPVGDVFEMTTDWYQGQLIGGVDPQGPATGLLRVIGGGSLWNSAWDLRSANRSNLHPNSSARYDVGFRVLRVTP